MIRNVNVSYTSTYTFNSLVVVAASVNSAIITADADTVEMRACIGAYACAFTHTYVMRIIGSGTSSSSTVLPAFFTGISGKTAIIAPTNKS